LPKTQGPGEIFYQKKGAGGGLDTGLSGKGLFPFSLSARSSDFFIMHPIFDLPGTQSYIWCSELGAKPPESRLNPSNSGYG
jgi:hypothetical protein